MNVEDFKREFTNELIGLSSARVLTLWKKSKTMSKAEVIEAITQSKNAQMRDKQRRSKESEVPHTQVKLESSAVKSTAPITAMKKEDEFPDWTVLCKQSEVDVNQLINTVNKLKEVIQSRFQNPKIQLVKTQLLYSTINDLLRLRIRRNNTFDILGFLNST